MAMGGGRNEEAISLLEGLAKSEGAGQQQEMWLLLKNLHLVVGWLGSLEKGRGRKLRESNTETKNIFHITNRFLAAIKPSRQGCLSSFYHRLVYTVFAITNRIAVSLLFREDFTSFLLSFLLQKTKRFLLKNYCSNYESNCSVINFSKIFCIFLIIES
jgi:hypothetical protein